LRNILRRAHLVLCDGTPLLWVSRLLGNNLKERVAGSDLVPKLLEVATVKQYKVFFLGGTQEVLDSLVQRLKEKYPGIQIVGTYSPPFLPLLDMNNEEMCELIKNAKPDILFVSFSCPKSEKWFFMNYQHLGIPVGIGVGATVDFLSGKMKRAPGIVGKCGLEWLYRLLQEPRRLYKRYLRDLWYFSIAIIRQWWFFNFNSRLNTQAEGELLLNTHPGHVEIILNEYFDYQTIQSNSGWWMSIIKDSKPCVIDMSNVRVIDSSGVGFLIWFYKKLKEYNGSLYLVSPSKIVLDAFQLLKLDGFFNIISNSAELSKISECKNEIVTLLVKGPVTSLIWHGEIVASNCDSIKEFCERHLKTFTQNNLSVDLSKVTFLDSSGVGMMVRLKKIAAQFGTKLKFINVNPDIRNVLKITNLENHLLS
jgi:N-acetylglucosaminyldiphosphoundecaprenol N-acetyl-beta-D-mannosaminyltransferase